LTINKGECVLLCGESGCGKTTLTRLINGLIPHFYEGNFSGSVRIADFDIAETKPEALAHIVGSVFQNPRSQFFNLDTTGEIAFGCENLGLPTSEIRARVQATARELGIENLLDRDIFALSGGEKQKIAVASAYALNPDIFVFDEPSSNLDHDACLELAALMKTLKQSGKTIVIAEHRLYYLTELIDRAIYIKDGKIEQEWTRDAFLALSDEQREALGLRATHLSELKPADDGRAMRAPTTPDEGGRAMRAPTTPDEGGRAMRAPTTPAALTVSGLSAGYKRGKPVLTDVGFFATPGEIIGIIGKNGAGKSTLARVLCGLHKEMHGAVALGDKQLKATVRAGTFYLVMQESGYQLFTDSVENELLLSASRKEKPSAEKVASILQSLSLTALSDRHPMSLSGGEKQRTAIGTAIAHNAAVLIFDEPTSGLDFGNMCRVSDVLKQLSADGKIIFVITHDFELLNRVCTRILILDGGKVHDDTPLDIQNLSHIKEHFT
jgi:energy-coupling factor transport system ATP-binding protein